MTNNMIHLAPLACGFVFTLNLRQDPSRNKHLSTYNINIMAHLSTRPAPHALLDKSSHLVSEPLLEMAAPHDIDHRNTIVKLQRRNPRLLHRHLVAANPYIAKRPALPKRGVNSFMAFRGRFEQWLIFFLVLISCSILLSDVHQISTEKLLDFDKTIMGQ
jgi:hypothetical protein